MSSVLCPLLAGILLALVLLGLAVRRGLRPMAAASAYRNVAWRLGLDADTRGVSLQGYLDGRRMFIGEVVDHDGRRRLVEVRAVLDLLAPLGLGLRIRPRNDSRLRRLRRQRAPSLEVGDPTLDDPLEVRAFEPDAAKALLVDEVRNALADMLEGWKDVEVTDHWVTVHLRRHPTSDRKLLALVEAMRRLATALEAARQGVPRPQGLDAWIAPWERLASERGLTLDPDLPRLHGELGGRRVSVAPVRTEHGFSADLKLTFRSHTPLGITLSPQHGPEGWRSLGQDIQVGAQAFDDAFVIKGWDPHAIRSVLTAPVRAELLALAQGRPVRLGDEALDVQDAAAEPEVLAELLDRMERVADALGW